MKKKLEVQVVHKYLVTWFSGNELNSIVINRDIVPITYKLDSVDNVRIFEKHFSSIKPGQQVVVVAFSFIESEHRISIDGRILEVEETTIEDGDNSGT